MTILFIKLELDKESLKKMKMKFSFKCERAKT